MNGLWTIPLLLLTTLAASGCASDCQTTNEAGGQRAVCTGTTFSYTRNGSMVSEKEEYQWENGKAKAAVSAAFNSSSGTVTIVVKDANGQTVYNKSHGWSGQQAKDELSSAGEPGAWTISINTGALTGQVAVNIRPA